MEKGLISIIVPIYNVEKYLKQCLYSICNQSYKNLEIILVDDGSPDNCGIICDNYAKNDDRIKVIHKENGGLSSARNAGLDVAKGEYISFIDSDDCIALNFIEKLYTLCIKNNADISECEFVKFENEINVGKINVNNYIYTPKEILEQMYSEKYLKTVVVWNKLYKKYIYDDLRFPLGKINEDEFCTYKAIYNCKTKIAVTEETLYYYRYNKESIMGRKFNLKRLDVLEALDERKEFYKNNNEAELYIKTLKKYSEVIRNFYELIKENIDDSKEYLKMLRNRLRTIYSEMKICTKIEVSCKLKNLVFIMCPNVYLWLKNINLFRKFVGVPELESRK